MGGQAVHNLMIVGNSDFFKDMKILLKEQFGSCWSSCLISLSIKIGKIFFILYHRNGLNLTLKNNKKDN
jgi:hypothetical protein